MTSTARSVPEAETSRSHDRFASDVRYYLAQYPRQLPSRYLYDRLGSALFEAICRLPWYPLTRAEARLLAAHGREILDAGDPFSTIVELGPGSGDKLALLLEAARPRRRPSGLHLIDVSSSALAQARHTLESLYDVEVIEHEATYEAGLAAFKAARLPDGRSLAMFLGSNIGNFDPPGREGFLRTVRMALTRGDGVLLGADLIKPARQMLLAYADPLGVTAAFNLNLLVRINRELDGDFDVDGFAHEAVWNPECSRVEMHLVSRRTQHVTIARAHLDFQMAEGERIWTESSYKFRPEQIASLLGRSGFRLIRQWVDITDDFVLTLAEAG